MSPKKARGINPGAEPDGGPGISPDVGLCSACTFARRVENRRGSVFYLCDRSAEDPRYPKYPPLPVLKCAGFVAMDPPPHP